MVVKVASKVIAQLAFSWLMLLVLVKFKVFFAVLLVSVISFFTFSPALHFLGLIAVFWTVLSVFAVFCLVASTG